MKDILLKDLLEAGCHFGHKTEKWHPKAASFIFQEKDRIHIIDLAKTRDSLKTSAEFVRTLALEGKVLLLVATKRQAKGVVTQAAIKSDCPYLTNRWIGGFITNWPEIKKNIDKLLKFRTEKEDGTWTKLPKHEAVNLGKILRKLEAIYGGVAKLLGLPDAILVVDIKKEDSCVKEALRKGIPVVAIVDTNTNPTKVEYPIPANDDAVGSIRYVVDYLSEAYLDGKKLREKQAEKEKALQEGPAPKNMIVSPKEMKKEEKPMIPEEGKNKTEIKKVKKISVKQAEKKVMPVSAKLGLAPGEVKKKRGRPKKDQK